MCDLRRLRAPRDRCRRMTLRSPSTVTSSTRAAQPIEDRLGHARRQAAPLREVAIRRGTERRQETVWPARAAHRQRQPPSASAATDRRARTSLPRRAAGRRRSGLRESPAASRSTRTAATSACPSTLSASPAPADPAASSGRRPARPSRPRSSCRRAFGSRRCASAGCRSATSTMSRIAAMYIGKSRDGSRCSVLRMLVVFTSSRVFQSAARTSSRVVCRRRVQSDSSAADITCA